MVGNNRMIVRWKEIETVLLDMDGTLLDLHFDDFFWREHVPYRFSQKEGLDLAAAKKQLFERYRQVEGTMEWYSVDYWSEELGLDIALLKQEVDHLIAVHPPVPEFLDAVRGLGKRAVLVTNAHGKSLKLKMDRTSLGGRLDALICAHDLGLPKEDVAFWNKLKEIEPFQEDKTLLIDDSLAVLRSAERHGIRHLVAVLKPNTRLPAQEVPHFPAILSFDQIVP